MSPSVMRGVWSLVLVCVCMYVFTSFFGTQIMAQTSGSNKPLRIRDVVEPGMHHLSGMIDVAFSCENVSVDSHRNGTTYLLEFNTWRDAEECSPGPMPRDFALTVEGPSDASFIATVDGVAVDIALARQTTTPLPPPLK